MAGFREFVTGEVLTAANVDDFLMKQSVQKYADAAARDAALGTAVAGGNALREGMIAYLDDTDEVLKYDGSTWSSVAPAPPAPPAGIGSNVVHASVATAVTRSSTSFGDTNLTATITPSSATSKILVLVTQPAFCTRSVNGDISALLKLLRGATDLGIIGEVGISAGTNVSGVIRASGNISAAYLDSPSTTSPVVYKTQGAASTTSNSGSSRFNTDILNNNKTSRITLIEVAA